jgi:hypothetical protein
MHILITGGTGLIGGKLIDHLFNHGHVVTVVSRQRYRPAILPAKLNFAQWDGKSAAGWGHLIEGVDAVVNLAGANLADGKWTDERKKIIWQSRVNSGQAISAAIQAAERKPRVVIQSSAVGYYGPGQDEVITESHPAGDDFLAQLCQAWEDSSRGVEAMGVRHAAIRTGLVLDMGGGGFPKMLIPFRLGAGGPVGSGQQWVPWIHYQDAVEAIRFLIETEAATGPFNLMAPYPLRNRDLARLIGKVMKRPAFLPAPEFALKFIFGEMSTILLTGQQALPRRLEELGFVFKFPTAEAALVDLLGKKTPARLAHLTIPDGSAA